MGLQPILSPPPQTILRQLILKPASCKGKKNLNSRITTAGYPGKAKALSCLVKFFILGLVQISVLWLWKGGETAWQHQPHAVLCTIKSNLFQLIKLFQPQNTCGRTREQAIQCQSSCWWNRAAAALQVTQGCTAALQVKPQQGYAAAK